jgi:hypothetical protein
MNEDAESLSAGIESSKKITTNKSKKAPQKKSVQKLIHKTSIKEEKHLLKKVDTSAPVKS